MRNWRVFFFLLLMSSVGMQPAYAAGQRVNLLGCVSRGVEAHCLVIKDRKTGRTYQINAANPKPDPAQHLAVRLKGRVTKRLDICQQGPILAEITWSYTKTYCETGK